MILYLLFSLLCVTPTSITIFDVISLSLPFTLAAANILFSTLSLLSPYSFSAWYLTTRIAQWVSHRLPVFFFTLFLASHMTAVGVAPCDSDCISRRMPVANHCARRRFSLCVYSDYFSAGAPLLGTSSRRRPFQFYIRSALCILFPSSRHLCTGFAVYWQISLFFAGFFACLICRAYCRRVQFWLRYACELVCLWVCRF